jgi:hypothetical protein
MPLQLQCGKRLPDPLLLPYKKNARQMLCSQSTTCVLCNDMRLLTSIVSHYSLRPRKKVVMGCVQIKLS